MRVIGQRALFRLDRFSLACCICAGEGRLRRGREELLFWAAFILTRPLGATVGDLLDKPHEQGGLGFGRFTASAALAAFILICILIVPQRAGSHGASDLAARDRSLP